jgi:hypothetical protein
MKSKIEIIHVVQVSGTSRKTGNDYDIRNAQCVVRDVNPETGEVQPKIGVLSLPARYKDSPKGVYLVEFDVAVDGKGRVVSEVGSVQPWDGSAPVGEVAKVMVEVLGVTPRTGFSKKSLKDYDMRFADCIVQKVDRETGEKIPLVGELLMPERFKDVQPGLYAVEFELAISQDKRIGGRVRDMTLQQAVTRSTSSSGHAGRTVAASQPATPSVSPAVVAAAVSSSAPASAKAVS